VPKRAKTGIKPARRTVFSMDSLSKEDQDRWAQALDMYQLRFFSISKFLDEVERETLANDMTMKYALRQSAPTNIQIAAVSSV
jgi:hypothetical protein